ncbi:vacuolar protein sorting-associated protein 18 homolog isoform X2 [Bombus vosnesenskii]|uniref:Vacuolar protein sorting-associated protein 18 homolog n=3 Tax=Pyrobombus TaxID=144703 RepID=A0A6J3LLS1_9HYME|nr:vacuolar protein sorting-associated protein 18 homolog isoform X2 [Bombus impatiens]XP_033186594.1 vacuolar protein sorting-associated protein 18 homolog isoform X2 [Bombus vancouverensis nearcticus]XP_033320564.1 vacuolar protein sorting-associated protein 18 homolog isoform X2 [Bombus bifarius]XP_033365661.1 vacuolar protein sorting-associated protein 18 homolog isoform X2 [Bombus vosnesenskii]XP_050489983.1 vacuolar protein sorting-associated protein 18 homolog isoform X2 [Bombus huntii]
MTSMFDQYEQASQRSKQVYTPPIRPDISTAGFIQMKFLDDGPIFIKQKVNFLPPDKILHLVVNNNIIVIAMANNLLLRIDMKHPDSPEEIDISKYAMNMEMSRMFLDPLGNHLLISLVPKSQDPPNPPPELFYLHRKTTKLKQAGKFKGHEITAIGWNFSNSSETTTGPILLGTSKGLIFETEIGLDGDKIFNTSLEQYWRQVFDIGKDSKPPITGLEFHKIPNTDKYVIIVTTLMRIYQYIGAVQNPEEKPLLQQIFNKYLNVQESFNEVINNLPYSKIQFYYPSLGILPKSFGWLTEPGIFYAQIDPKIDPKSVLTNQQMLICPEASLMGINTSQTSTPPLSFVLTEFHALLLYTDRVKGMSLLNQDLIFEDIYNDAVGGLLNITKDYATRSIWAYSERAVFKYKVNKEDRNVWQIYVDKGEFELAKQYCKDNPAHIDQVLVKQAEMLFKNKEYEKSALIYADTHSSFEVISLKFLQEWQIDALKTFLKKKLEGLKTQDKTQITMIVVWVIELFMNQMGVLRSNNTSYLHDPQYLELQKQFDSFLAIPKVEECIKRNRSTIYDLMASHGDKDNLIRLTIMHCNYEEVIRQHLYKNNYLDALEVLKSQNNKELFYQFAGILLQELPRPAMTALISQGSLLKPSKLLPALVSCNSDEKHAKEVIRYLEFCVYKQSCQEQAIHNFLLSLYARYKRDEVMRYISSQGQDINMVHYDVHYALRLCQEVGLTEACVQLSALLGLWTTAVDLALTINVDLAKQIAAMPSDHDDELRKKLWLKIAEHVVREKDDIQQAMEFLQHCDIVRIEDILPFFSDFVTIDHFKDAICNSLQEYNQHIQDLKEEMQEATKAAELIRKDIQEFRTRCTFINTKDTCNTCGVQLLLRPFYVFPCGHRFHSDCLVAALTPMLSMDQRTKLADLQRQLTALSNRPEDTRSVRSVSLSTKDQIKADIDDLIASECLYCGELMIESIDKPFIEEEDYERVMKEWI